MKPYDIIVTKVSDLKSGDLIFIVKNQATPEIFQPARCAEDIEIMESVCIDDIVLSNGFSHRFDIISLNGICAGLLAGDTVFLVKPKINITVKPDEIEIKGIVTKKVPVKGTDEITIYFDSTKVVRFLKFENKTFDVLGKPENFSSLVGIAYQEMDSEKGRIIVPVVSINEKIEKVSIVLDRTKPVAFHVPDVPVSKDNVKIPAELKLVKSTFFSFLI